jgi:hypothetical protein
VLRSLRSFQRFLLVAKGVCGTMSIAFLACKLHVQLFFRVNFTCISLITMPLGRFARYYTLKRFLFMHRLRLHAVCPAASPSSDLFCYVAFEQSVSLCHLRAIYYVVSPSGDLSTSYAKLVLSEVHFWTWPLFHQRSFHRRPLLQKCLQGMS